MTILSGGRSLIIPDVVDAAMRSGATAYVSISGGKDSQALANAVTAEYHRRSEWGGVISAIHMDLGRAEWPQTPAQVEQIASENDLELIVVSRPQGDLVDEIFDRMIKLRGTDKPFWPSSAARYCTADQKRSQADKVYRDCQLVISVEGIRADESPARAKKEALSIRQSITSKPLRKLSPEEALRVWREFTELMRDGRVDEVVERYPEFEYYTREGATLRLALNWYAIFDWTIDDVWAACGTSTADIANRRELYRRGEEEGDDDLKNEALTGWQGHPAYVFGNDRLSCALCVLGNKNDLRNGMKHNPDLFQTYLFMEEVGGSTFKNGWSLAELLEDKVSDEADFIQLPLMCC